ncbi:MAG: hypothetical protein GEV03_21315 [Streptosporangiales bacterium]|nr:hypothetical protein [Streptosporangiales bacterium]
MVSMRKAHPESIQLLGGTLALDFVNTVNWSVRGEHVAPEVSDALTNPELLARWGRRLGLLAVPPRPAVDTEQLARARRLRDAVYRVFAAVARGDPPDNADMDTIASDYAEAVAQGHLARGGVGWRWEWPPADPRRLRFAVVVDAINLLQDADRLARVARCPGRHCGWLFINASSRRRWCSMGTCGSRDKMRRMYRRKHLRS